MGEEKEEEEKKRWKERVAGIYRRGRQKLC